MYQQPTQAKANNNKIWKWSINKEKIVQSLINDKNDVKSANMME